MTETQPLLPTTGNASEITRLQALLDARSPNGVALKGYARNVALLRSRIAQLQTLDIPKTAWQPRRHGVTLRHSSEACHGPIWRNFRQDRGRPERQGAGSQFRHQRGVAEHAGYGCRPCRSAGAAQLARFPGRAQGPRPERGERRWHGHVATCRQTASGEMTKFDQTNGVAVAEESLRGSGRGPGVALGDRAAESLSPQVSPPGRPGRHSNGHTTSGLDYAMSTLADRLHPVWAVDGEHILHGVRKHVVFLSAYQAAHYGGYVPAVESLHALILPPGMIEEYHQDLQHMPVFYECGHAWVRPMLPAIILCMIVTNRTLAPVELHGCVPAVEWTTQGCAPIGEIMSAPDTEDPNSSPFSAGPPISLTVAPGRNVFTDDADYTLFGRLWDDGPMVFVHWQEGGPCIWHRTCCEAATPCCGNPCRSGAGGCRVPSRLCFASRARATFGRITRRSLRAEKLRGTASAFRKCLIRRSKRFCRRWRTRCATCGSKWPAASRVRATATSSCGWRSSSASTIPSSTPTIFDKTRRSVVTLQHHEQNPATTGSHDRRRSGAADALAGLRTDGGALLARRGRLRPLARDYGGRCRQVPRTRDDAHQEDHAEHEYQCLRRRRRLAGEAGRTRARRDARHNALIIGERLSCKVVGCGRTRTKQPCAPVQWQEFLCCKHWPLVPKKFRRVLSRIHREVRRRGSFDGRLHRTELRIWRRCVRAAQELAVGI